MLTIERHSATIIFVAARESSKARSDATKKDLKKVKKTVDTKTRL